MDNESLSYRTLKNISYSFVGFVVPMAFSVFITPVIVHKLGVAEYGILILTNTILGLLGLLDLGLTASVVKYISEYHALGEWEKLRRALRSANTLYWLIGFVNLAVFLILGKFFLWAFHISGVSQQHILIVFLLAGLTSFLTAINSIYTSIPPALQRFDIVNKINLSQLAVYNLGALILALLGFQLKAILALNLLTVAGMTLAYRIFSQKLLPFLRLRFTPLENATDEVGGEINNSANRWRSNVTIGSLTGFVWDKAELKKLYSFGIFSAIANISMSAVNQFDRLLIPIFLGPVQLSYYSLPGNVAQKTTTVVGSLGGTFFPMANTLAAKGEVQKLGEIFRKVIRNLSVLAAATTASIMLFGEKILRYWLGEEFAARGAEVLLILAVTYFLLSLFGIIYNFLMGLNRQKAVALWSMAMAIVNLILLFALLKPFGIIGVAWAYLFSVLPVIYLFYWMEKKVFNSRKIFSFYFKLLLKLCFTALAFAVIVRFSLYPVINNLTTLIVLGPLTVVFYMLLYRLFGFFEQEDLEIFKSFGGKIFEKFGIRKASKNENP